MKKREKVYKAVFKNLVFTVLTLTAIEELLAIQKFGMCHKWSVLVKTPAYSYNRPTSVPQKQQGL